MPKQKFYVVWKGRQPGVYNNWEDCKAQVERFSGAQFKSFKSREVADDAFKEGGPPKINDAHKVESDNWDDVPWN